MNENKAIIDLEEYNELRDFREKMEKDYVCTVEYYSGTSYKDYITKDQAIADLGGLENHLRVENRKLEEDLKHEKARVDVAKSSNIDKNLLAIKSLLTKKGFWHKIKICYGIWVGNGEIINLARG